MAVSSRRVDRLRLGATLLAVVVSLLPARLAAQEFAFHEPGARAAGLGGAFTGRADDASALIYNPAGLAFLGGLRVKTNLTFGHRTLEAAWPDGGASHRSNPNEILGGLVAAWQPLRRVTVAAGSFSPYTYSSLWFPTFGVESDCNQNSLKTTYLRSVLAVEVFKGFALSGGVDVVTSKLEWKHNVPIAPGYFTDSRHSLHGHGWGFVAGVLWKIVPAFQVGARYHRDVAVDLAGDTIRVGFFAADTAGALSAANRGTPLATGPVNYFRSQAVTGRVTLPGELAFGAAFTPVPRLSFYADAVRHRWRDFGDWIFRPAVPGSDPDYGTQGLPLVLKDTTSLKAGLEFRPGRYIAFRGGYANMESAVDAAHRTLVYPDLERNVYALGFGYEGPLFSVFGGDERLSDLSFDICVRYAAAVPAASTYPGYELTYRSGRVVLNVGVGLVF